MLTKRGLTIFISGTVIVHTLQDMKFAIWVCLSLFERVKGMGAFRLTANNTTCNFDINK